MVYAAHLLGERRVRTIRERTGLDVVSAYRPGRLVDLTVRRQPVGHHHVYFDVVTGELSPAPRRDCVFRACEWRCATFPPGRNQA